MIGIYYPHMSELIKQTLQLMRRDSYEANLAVEMIIAHESLGGRYLKQKGGGPARGVIQMEHDTYESVWDHADYIQLTAQYARQTRGFEQLSYDLKHNIFMARAYLLMDPNPLPGTPEAMSVYLKGYYNTAGGEATPTEYLEDWKKWTGRK